jgi:hypothetical protein
MAAKNGAATIVRQLATRYPNLSKAEIARRAGCTRQSVSYVLDSFLDGDSEESLREYQTNQADIFDALSHRLLRSVTAEKIEKSKPMEAITGAAILIDKARLVRGQATAINVNVLLDIAEALRSKPALDAEPIRTPSASE